MQSSKQSGDPNRFDNSLQVRKLLPTSVLIIWYSVNLLNYENSF